MDFFFNIFYTFMHDNIKSRHIVVHFEPKWCKKLVIIETIFLHFFHSKYPTVPKDLKVVFGWLKSFVDLFHSHWCAKRKMFYATQSLLPISEFVLDEKFQRNASKFAIYIKFTKTQSCFSVFHFVLLYNFT